MAKLEAILATDITELPKISIVIPARNELQSIRNTLVSIDLSRTSDHKVEVVIVDDASTIPVTEIIEKLAVNIVVRVVRSEVRLGVPGARNKGCENAEGEILFITDAHVDFPHGWDSLIVSNVADNRILVGTIFSAPKFRSCGCRLVVPYMGTWWNGKVPKKLEPVQVAPCSVTIIPSKLFKSLGGYDLGMRMYGAAEPEFSVRAWLSGAEILALPELVLEHKFKDKEQRNNWVADHRTDMVHNGMRFGLLYLSKQEILRMIRHYTMVYPSHMQEASRLLSESDVWERRDELESSFKFSFGWYIEKFSLRNQIGHPILN